MTARTKVAIGVAALVLGGVYLFRFRKPSRPRNWFAIENPTMNPYPDDTIGGGIGIIVTDPRTGDSAAGDYHWQEPRP